MGVFDVPEGWEPPETGRIHDRTDPEVDEVYESMRGLKFITSSRYEKIKTFPLDECDPNIENMVDITISLPCWLVDELEKIPGDFDRVVLEAIGMDKNAEYLPIWLIKIKSQFTRTEL